MTAGILSLSLAIKDRAVLMRLLAVALLAGLIAGAVTGAVQVLHLQPLILEAERYEGLASTDHHHHDKEEAPLTSTRALSDAHQDQDAFAAIPPREAPNFQRIVFLVITSLISGVAFALLLTATYTLLSPRVTWTLDARTGVLWGLAGFAAFSLAPALGLPPELPGIVAAELTLRQFWWVFTALATAAGLGALVFGRRARWGLAGVTLLILPHVIGAPRPPAQEIHVPADLVIDFITFSLNTTGLFWLILGISFGFFYPRLIRLNDPALVPAFRAN